LQEDHADLRPFRPQSLSFSGVFTGFSLCMGWVPAATGLSTGANVWNDRAMNFELLGIGATERARAGPS
jgi:hypothetical protein